MRTWFRTLSVLLLISLAVFVPFVSSGYSELKQARSAESHLQAAEHYRSAAQRIPWRADLYELAGHEYYYAKEYSLADASYQKAFQRNVISSQGWVAWGDVNYLNGHSDHAAEIWDQGLKQAQPSDVLYSRLAQIYKEQKKYAKATEYLQRYVSNHSDDASAHYRLGLFLTLSDPNTAASELVSASQLDPQFDPAVQTLRTALSLASINNSPSERLVIIGRGLGLVHEWELAHVAFEQGVQADENNAEAWAWLGEANQQTGVDGSAELNQALDLNPNSSIVRGLRGLNFQRVGNYREALTEFQFAARLDSKNPAWMVSIGETYSKLGDLIRALEAYQYATSLAPDDANYWHLLAKFCAQNNIHVRDVGIAAGERAVVIKPDDSGLQDLLGWLLLLNTNNPEAERHFLRALELDPQNASAHFHLALVYLQTDDRASAYDHLIRARDLGNKEAEAVLNQYFP